MRDTRAERPQRRAIGPVADHEAVPWPADRCEGLGDYTEVLLRYEPADEQHHDRVGGDPERTAGRDTLARARRMASGKIDRVRDVLAFERWIDVRREPRAHARIHERDARRTAEHASSDRAIRAIEQRIDGPAERDHRHVLRHDRWHARAVGG